VLLSTDNTVEIEGADKLGLTGIAFAMIVR